MDYIYKRIYENGKTQLVFSEKIHLAGCNIGLIPKLLKEKLSPSDNPLLGWVLLISENFNKINQSIIIDIKPRSTNEVFLCELDAVFGFSYHEWSPTMYRLKILYNDAISPDEFDKNNFVNPDSCEIIYTTSYLSGSFKNGSMIGTWNPPSPNPKNSLLFWPETMTFFIENIKKFDTDFLKATVDIISAEKDVYKQ